MWKNTDPSGVCSGAKHIASMNITTLNPIQMNQFVETVFNKSWWQWNPDDGQWFSLIYHWFNILEGIAWVIFAALVLFEILAA